MSYGMEGRTPLIDKPYENFYYVNDNERLKRIEIFVRKFLDENIEFYDAFSKKVLIPIYEWIPKKSLKSYYQELLS